MIRTRLWALFVLGAVVLATGCTPARPAVSATPSINSATASPSAERPRFDGMRELGWTTPSLDVPTSNLMGLSDDEGLTYVREPYGSLLTITVVRVSWDGHELWSRTIHTPMNGRAFPHTVGDAGSGVLGVWWTATNGTTATPIVGDLTWITRDGVVRTAPTTSPEGAHPEGSRGLVGWIEKDDQADLVWDIHYVGSDGELTTMPWSQVAAGGTASIWGQLVGHLVVRGTGDEPTVFVDGRPIGSAPRESMRLGYSPTLGGIVLANPPTGAVRVVDPGSGQRLIDVTIPCYARSDDVVHDVRGRVWIGDLIVDAASKQVACQQVLSDASMTPVAFLPTGEVLAQRFGATGVLRPGASTVTPTAVIIPLEQHGDVVVHQESAREGLETLAYPLGAFRAP